MSYRIKDNTLRINLENTQNASLGLRFLAEAIVQTSQPRTPKKSGRLRADVLKHVLGLHGTIEWRKAYAERQEKNQFRHYTTPGTGPHFAESAVRFEAARADIYFRRARMY